MYRPLNEALYRRKHKIDQKKVITVLKREKLISITKKMKTQ